MTDNTNPTNLRVGIVGCGQVAQQYHLPALARLPGLQVTALVDQDRDRLDAAGQQYAVNQRYSSLADMLAGAEVDVVAVCLPPALHAAAALPALQAGKHVFIEKPLALTLADCTEIANAAAQASGKTMIGFNLRWHRLLRQARAWLREERLGQLLMLRTRFSNHARLTAAATEWRSQPDAGGGALLDLGVHHVDLWRWLSGTEIREISAMQVAVDAVDRSVCLSAQLDNGVMVQSFFSEHTSSGQEIEGVGTEGLLRISPYRFDGFFFEPARNDGGLQRAVLDRTRHLMAALPRGLQLLPHGGDFAQSYSSEWRHFRDCIVTDQQPEPTAADGYKAQQAVLAALESLETGRPVTLSHHPS